MSQKLSARKPSGYMKVKLMKEIANENGIGWKFENFLDGSDCFTEPMKIDRSSRHAYEASSVLENTNHISELDKWPVNSKRLKPAPEISSSAPLSPVSSLDDDEKEKMHNLFSAKNGNGKLPDTENYDSHLHFVLENRKKTSVKPTRSRELGSSERYQKSSRWVEDKSVQSKGKKTRNESPTGNDCCNSARYSRADELYVEYKGVKIRYTDVATAAHEALDSAEHATMAAHAALTLASREYNQNSSQTTDDSSEISSNSSDEAFERSFLRDTNEQRHLKQIRGFTSCGVSKHTEKQRGTYDHSDVDYQRIGNDFPDRKKAQGGREACFNKPIYNWAKPKSNNQSFPSKYNQPHSILDDFKSDRSVPLLGRKQYQDPKRVTNRCMSERRLRPRMSFAEEAETERSSSSRLSNTMQSDDFERIKVRFRSKTPMPTKSKPLEFYGKDESYQAIATANKFIVSQNSHKEGLCRSEGSGKLRWYSANLQDQETHFISIDEIESKNSYNNVGNDGEIRSYMSGEFSTELEVNQKILGHQEKISRSKNFVDSKDSKLKGNKEDCARIDLDRLPKSLRSWKMQLPSKADE
ncbi:uncharacterized protein LOC131072429 [Cryptomeria japonica]|uniref:uncharacterized protein LOC131072429 n=1 Tax=Cryptomeria japonica TaxID=3369 RepID=UPI0027DA0C6F|nr:uncharacterized protein LOC131072429 [Cryptomeria japonica]